MLNVIKTQMTAAIVLLMAFIGFAGNNEQLLKMYTGKDIGAVQLNKETMFADLKGVGRAFYITVSKDANYFISVITNGAAGKEYDVTVDIQSFVEGKAKLENGWKADFMVDPSTSAPKSLHLAKGEHVISFIGKGPEVPNIERIRIAENQTDAQLSAADLASWTKTLAAKVLPANYSEMKKNGTLSSSLTAAVSSPSDPLYDYYGALNNSFNYSSFHNIYLNANTVFTVETQNSTADPVLYVFLQNNPQQFSVVNDDYNSTISYESKVSFTTPVAGFYAVLVRSYWAGQNGVGNILYNGSVHFSNGAISGTLVQFPTSTKTGTLNCFTALPGGETDTRLFTMSGPLSPVNGYNDDWQGSSECDFDWGHLSRIRQNYTSSIKACLITHYDAGQSGTCDVYTACSDGITMGFPNFKIRDAIMSAPATPDRRYNCIAWSGGLTSNWVNPYYTLRAYP